MQVEDKIKALIVGYLKSNANKFLLENCKLQEIPFNIAILEELKVLNLRKNLLKQLPLELKSFNILTELDISFNSFDYCPTEIKYLKSLKILICHHNQISKISDEIFINLNKLEILNINFNNIVFIPETISSCRNLKKLHCSHNSLSNLPESLSQCSDLKEIHAGYNEITSIPELFGDLLKLEILIIHKNQLENLPENIADMVSLRVLDVAANNIQVMPSEINEMSLLEFYYEANPLLTLDPVHSQQVDEVMPLLELSLRALAKELQKKGSYLHVKIKHFPLAQEMLMDSGECALCGGAYRDIWIECVKFVKRNPKMKSSKKSPLNLPTRAAICSQTCFSSKEHQFFGVANL